TAPSPGVGVRAPQRAAARHGRRQSSARRRRRNHGHGAARAPGRRRISSRCVLHRRTTRGSAGVRGRVAASGLVTRRQWGIAILAAWGLSLGWLVKREMFRPTAARLAEAALAVPPAALFYGLDARVQQKRFESCPIQSQ